MSFAAAESALMYVNTFYATYEMNIRLPKFIEITTKKNVQTMNEYAKVILPKVSFSKELFQKELMKCVKWVEKPNELDELTKWCYDNFGEMYPEVLEKVFSHTAA